MDRDLVLRTIDRWSDESASFFFRPGLGRLIEVDRHTDSRAYVLELASFYEERSLVTRSAPYRGEPLTPGQFEGLWSLEVLPQQLFAEETRELIAPGTERVSICGSCIGDGRVQCPRCDGGKRDTFGNCSGKGKTRCSDCQGDGRVYCGS